MLKRVALIALLVFGLTGLLQTQAIALTGITLSGSGFSYTPGNCYYATWRLVGGSNPTNNLVAVLASDGITLQDALVCKNPGGDWDVRQGKGGISIDLSTAIDNSSVTSDKNGQRFVKSAVSCSFVGEILSDNTVCTQDLFNATWLVNQSMCRNFQWTPYAYLIQGIKLIGTVFNYCPENWTDPETQCTGRTNNVAMYCETDQGLRTWPIENGVVSYLCNYWGSPLAWDDNFTVSAGRTLKVKVPGVLGNDHDTGESTTSLTAVKVSDPSNGTLTLNSDGSFSYMPSVGFSGENSFTYQAIDGDGNFSNVATVTITVNP